VTEDDHGRVQPTVETFHALARSSPWRWTTLHFRHRSAYPGEAEAWVRRPGELLVRRPTGELEYVSGVPYSTSPLMVTASPEGEGTVELRPEPEPPVFRPDGLVATRPDAWYLEHSDPMWGNYSWTAMLDPEELSHHVEVSGLREVEVAGRPAWRADLRAQLGYLPRCGGNCCDLIYSEAGLRADFPDPDDVPERMRGRTYPDHYDVALDVQTGVVVRCLPVGGADGASWLENDILGVDEDLHEVFAGRR
jgi:hypothetical protein